MSQTTTSNLNSPSENSCRNSRGYDDEGSSQNGNRVSSSPRSSRSKRTLSSATGNSPCQFSLSQLMEDRLRTDDSPRLVIQKDNSPLTPNEQSVTLYCQSDCKYDRVSCRKMLRCCTCMVWHHFDCVGEKEKTGGVWSCLGCRKIPSLMLDLATQVAALKSVVLRNEKDDITKHIDHLTSEVETLRKANDVLHQQVDKLTAENLSLRQNQAVTTMNSSNPQLPSSKPKMLLLGSSLLRNIQSKDANQLQVICRPGATLDSLQNEIQRLDAHYDKITIVGGGNDCSKAEISTVQISERTHSLLTEASKHTNSLALSSVLPRTEGDIQLKIDAVNTDMAKQCKSIQRCDFVANDGTFKLADLTPNEAMFVKDGVHLSQRGSQRLLQNLCLTDVAEVTRSPYQHRQGNNRRGGSNHKQTNKRIPFDHAKGRQGSRCTWCRESHPSATCPKRGNRTCFACSSPSHRERQCAKR